MTSPLEKSLEFPFFISELSKWIGIQEIGRLKCTSKTIQSKLTIQNIRFILEGNIIFQTLIFRNQLEIIEQIIPFKFNKRKQKFSDSILKSLFNKAAKEGKLSLISKLLSDECRNIFACFNLSEIARISAENGHFELSKFIFLKLDLFLENQNLIDEIDRPKEEIRQSLQEQFLYHAYRKKDQEFTKWLLGQKNVENSEDKLFLLSVLDFYEYNWYLSSMYTFADSNLASKLNDTLQNDQFDNHVRFLANALPIPDERLIDRFENMPVYNVFVEEDSDDESSFGKVRNQDALAEKQRERSVYCMRICWHAFHRRESDANWYFEQLEKFKFWPLIRNERSQSTLKTIIDLTIDRNLPNNFFLMCLDACKTSSSSNSNNIEILPDAEEMSNVYNEIRYCAQTLINAKRKDLLSNFLSLFPKNQLFPECLHFAILVDLNMVKFVLSYGVNTDFKVDIKKVLDGNDLEIAKILYSAHRISFSTNSWFACVDAFCANFDLLRFVFSCQEFRNELEQSNIIWLELIRSSLMTKSEEFVRFLFSQTSEFSNLTPQMFSSSLEFVQGSSSVVVEMLTSVLDVFNSELEKLKKKKNM